MLPNLTDSGTLVDLALLSRAVPEELLGGVQEVWSTGPPDDAVEETLAAAGLEVPEVRTATEREAAFGRGGPARVLALLSVLAVVALALAVLGQVSQALAQARPVLWRPPFCRPSASRGRRCVGRRSASRVCCSRSDRSPASSPG